MLLTDINSIILKINNIDVNVIINFKTLENLYHFLKDDYLRGVIAIDCNDPFKFIEKIDSENNILNYVSVLIFCMADGKIQLSDIAEGLLKFEENEFNELVKVLKITIINQLLFIEKSEKVNKKSEIKDSEYSLEEFYNLTPAKLKQIININNDNKKNLLLSVAADIVSAIFKDSKNTKQNEVIIAKDANAFFDAI